MYTKTEKIAMADGREIIVGNIPYHVKDGILYVGMTTDGGYDYVPMGRVKEGEEEAEEISAR